MLRSLAVRLLVVVSLLAPYAAMAQEVSPLKALVDGTIVPNKLKPQDLTNDYWPVNLTMGGGGYMDMMAMGMRFAFMGASSGGDNEQMGLFKAMQVSWTKGQVVRMGDARFLAVYRLDMDPGAFGPQKKSAPILSLVLVKPEAITSIGAVPDYTPDLYRRDLGVDPSGNPAANPAGDKTRTMSNAKQAVLGVIMYAADWDDEIPYVQSVKSLQATVMPYVKNNEVWKTYNPAGGRFLMNMSLAGVDMTLIESPAETPLLYEEKEWPDGTRLVAYADGHTEYVHRDDWSKMQPLLKLKLKRSGKPLPLNWNGGYPGTESTGKTVGGS